MKKVDLLDSESIILGIGDIKLSDTYYTFGESKVINGYEYKNLVDLSSVHTDYLPCNIVYGDFVGAVLVDDGTNKIILEYGANRFTSNAQSMAIGYNDETEYFFLYESFGNIYSEYPRLTERRIITVENLKSLNTKQKRVFCEWELGKLVVSNEEINRFNELISKIKNIENAFKEDNLNTLSRIRRKK